MNQLPGYTQPFMEILYIKRCRLVVITTIGHKGRDAWRIKKHKNEENRRKAGQKYMQIIGTY